jgi:hypothetical protein
MISIFEYTHPNCIGIFVFDWSSAYKGFAEDALNVNAMNLNPGEKQKKMHNTIIPLNNLDPAPGDKDMCGTIQQMCFHKDHKDLQLQG